MPTITDLVEAAHGGSLRAKVDLRGETHRLLSGGAADRSELDRFLRAGNPREWITFDESMRALWYGEDGAKKQPSWQRALHGVRPADTVPSNLLAVGVASMDRDGRVREAAVRQLAAEPDSLVGPFLALRTTDWVDQVATRAVTVLTERIASDAAVLISSAPLLFTLADRQRGSGIERIVLERAAAGEEVRTALLASAEIRTRRLVIGDRAVRQALTLDELVRLSGSDPDTVVASTAGIEAVSKIAASGAAPNTLERLLTGPALVRRAVLDALADHAEGRHLAERYLFDRSPAVRAAAQRAYRRSQGDPAIIYRAALGRSEHVPIVVTELAQVGSNADHETILSALQSADVATRRATVAAMKWIAGERLGELVAPLLWDPSAGVTRAAERRLRARARDLDGAMLLDLAAALQGHNRRAAYRLLRRRTAPERVEADLIALADEDEHNRHDAIADVRSWLHRGAASAARGDLPTRRRLSQRLYAVDHLLRRDDVAGIRFHAGLRPHDLQG